MSEPNDTHTTAWRFVRRRQARGSPPRRRATARYRRECKPPEPCVFSKNLPGFQKLFKSLLCQNSQISLNLRSAHRRGGRVVLVCAARLAARGETSWAALSGAFVFAPEYFTVRWTSSSPLVTLIYEIIISHFKQTNDPSSPAGPRWT